MRQTHSVIVHLISFPSTTIHHSPSPVSLKEESSCLTLWDKVAWKQVQGRKCKEINKGHKCSTPERERVKEGPCSKPTQNLFVLWKGITASDNLYILRHPHKICRSSQEFGSKALRLNLDKAKKVGRKRESTLAPTPSDSCWSASTCLSSEEAVEEASLWWRVRPVHVQVRAQCPVSLVDIDFFEALHLNHLQREEGWVILLDTIHSLVVVDSNSCSLICKTTVTAAGLDMGIFNVKQHPTTVLYTFNNCCRHVQSHFLTPNSIKTHSSFLFDLLPTIITLSPILR